MKKILIAGLLAVSSTGALFTPAVFADDDDNRSDRRDYRRDDRDRGPRDGDYDRDRDHRPGNNRPDWNGPRPGNGVPPRNGGYIPPRPLPNNGYGYGRPGNGYGRPGNGYGRPGNGYGRPGNGYGRPGYSRPNNGYGYGRPGNNNYYGGGYNGGYGGNYGNQNLDNIANRIESALRNDRQLSRYRLGTDTVRGTIELEGSVRSNNERQRAISIARDIARGVQINASRLQVRY